MFRCMVESCFLKFLIFYIFWLFWYTDVINEFLKNIKNILF